MLTGIFENVLRGGLNGPADPDDAPVSVADDDGAAAVVVVVPRAVDHRAAATADVESCRRVRRRGCGAWRRSAASLQF